MKMSKSYILLLPAVALVLAFLVPLKAQDLPRDYLNAHNRVRVSVGVGPLVWNETVAGYARGYARLRSDCTPVFSRGPYGEVLVWGSTDLSADEAVSVMVSQRSDYSYATNTCRVGRSCEAYLQVVWRNTVSLGCAKVVCVDGESLTICEYDPTGNVVGERPY